MVKYSKKWRSLGLKDQCQDVSSIEWSPVSEKRWQGTEKNFELDSSRRKNNKISALENYSNSQIFGWVDDDRSYSKNGSNPEN